MIIPAKQKGEQHATAGPPALGAGTAEESANATIVHEAAAHVTSRVIATAMARVVVSPETTVCPPDGFLPPRLDNTPPELQVQARWVTWVAEGGPGEKPRKVPYNVTLLNSRASSTDSETWGTFAQAEAAYSEGGRSGVGIVLNGDGLVGIDIDHCVTNGVIDPSALALLSALGAKYVEFSPSVTGLRAFGYSDGLAVGCKGKYNGLDVELYSTGRYLTVTGASISHEPISRLKGFKQACKPHPCRS